MKTHILRFIHSEDFDTLEMWLPEFSTASSKAKYESGLYDSYFCSRRKGAKRAFDGLLIDAFSAAYQDLLDEVKHKEPPVERENYDVPELGLYQTPLSRILEEIYCRFVTKQELSWQKTAAVAA